MAASTALKGTGSQKTVLTVVRVWTSGATTGKRNRIKTVSFADATNGLTVGGTTNVINASDFGMTKIERCSNVMVVTTATGAPVKIVPAVVSTDGSKIYLADAANATAANQEGAADVVLTTAQTGYITVEGV